MTFYSAAVLGFGIGSKRYLSYNAHITVNAIISSQNQATEFCRICHDIDLPESTVSLCKCKGTVRLLHVSCLEHWLEESGRDSCELCGESYPIVRKLHYGVAKGLFMWFCKPRTRHSIFSHVRSVRADILVFSLLTPVTILGTYFCLLAADFYSQEQNVQYPPARWTTMSLLIMVAILIFGYYMWMYISLRYHFRVWFYWWQRNSTVRLLHQQAEGNTNSCGINPTRDIQNSSQRQAHTTTIEIETEDIITQHIPQPRQNDLTIVVDSNSLQMHTYDAILKPIMTKHESCSPNLQVKSSTIHITTESYAHEIE